MKKYLYILLALAIFACLANAAAVRKPKALDPEDSSEDEPKTSHGASSNATRSPKEGLGNGVDTRSVRPGGRAGTGKASNGAGGKSSSAAGGITSAGSSSRPTGSDASAGDVAKEQKPQAPKNPSEKVPPKKLGGDTNKNPIPKAVTDKVPGGDSSDASGEEASANGRSGSGTGANKGGSRRNIHDVGTDRRNSSSPATSVDGSGSGSGPEPKKSSPATVASPPKAQEAPKKGSDKVTPPTPGETQRGGSARGATVEGLRGVPGKATGGVRRPNAAAGSGGGTTSASSGQNSNGGATRGPISRLTGIDQISTGSGQISTNRSTVAEGAGASARSVRKPKGSPLSGGRGVSSGSSGSGGSNGRAGSGYAPGDSSSGVLGVEDRFPEGLGAAAFGATSDDGLSGPGRGVFPSGLGEGSLREGPSRGPRRGTSGFGGPDFGSPISGSSGLGRRFPAGLGPESAVGSSRISGGSPGGGTFGSADSGFGSLFSGSSIGEPGRGAGERPGRAGGRGRSQFSGGLSGGFGESGDVPAVPRRGLPRNSISSGSSGPGQEFPEGLGGGSLGESSRGGVAGHRESTPVAGSSSSGWSGSGRGSSGLSRGRGKPGAPKTAAAVLGGLAGAAALGAITAGIAAAVQGQGGQSKPKNARPSKPRKRGYSRSCRRHCKGSKLCLAFCRREKRSISDSRVPVEILDEIPTNFDRLY